MNKELIFLGSITRTMRARDILKANGIGVKIERKTDDYDKNGCGYGIIVVSGDVQTARLILNEHGFKIDSE